MHSCIYDDTHEREMHCGRWGYVYAFVDELYSRVDRDLEIWVFGHWSAERTSLAKQMMFL